MSATKKRLHDLYRCRDAAEFATAFADATGRKVGDVVRELCIVDDPCGIVLGGSLPLGLGTATSDVDLLVLLDNPDGETLTKPSARTGVVFAGRAAEGGGGVACGEVVAFIEGIEVNCQLLSAVSVEHASRRIARAQIALTPYEIGLMSRLKTGWTLERTATFDARCAPLLGDEALELHSAVWYLVGAMQDLEDARAALADCTPLALHLGRSAAERGVLAYFASRGIAYIGAKWLRAFEPAQAAGRVGVLAGDFPGGREALRILFPSFPDAASYVERVAAFVADLRRDIETLPACRIAIALCPQLRTAA